MVSRNATLALTASAAPPAEIPPPVRARCCGNCENRATCVIARYTDGEVEICSEWQERKSAA
jgi:hypothetical protein